MPARVLAFPAMRCYLYCYLTFRPSGGARENDRVVRLRRDHPAPDRRPDSWWGRRSPRPSLDEGHRPARPSALHPRTAGRGVTPKSCPAATASDTHELAYRQIACPGAFWPAVLPGLGRHHRGSPTKRADCRIPGIAGAPSGAWQGSGQRDVQAAAGGQRCRSRRPSRSPRHS